MNKRTQQRAAQAAQQWPPLALPAVALVVMAVLVGAVLLLQRNEPPATQPSAEQGLPPAISAEQAYALYQQPDVFFLDVREPFEWEAIRIPNSTLIPLGQLANRVDELPRDKQIVVVCRSGNRSQAGRDILKRAGFAQVTSMNGGVNAWRARGFPTLP
ncbi:MAG: rhodanese-like domain-containing protein [Thermoflexales bacterium]